MRKIFNFIKSLALFQWIAGKFNTDTVKKTFSSASRMFSNPDYKRPKKSNHTIRTSCHRAKTRYSVLLKRHYIKSV